MGKREEELLLWEMINFELGETLEYLKDLKGVWRKLSSENRKLILHIVSGSLPSDEQLMELSKIADKYMYEGVNDDIHIGCKGITALIKAWDKMRQ